MLYAVLVAVLIGLDQWVKYLVRVNLPLYGSAPLVPHLVELTYVQNTGAAFSLFSEHTWMLAIVSAVVAIGISVLIFKQVVRHPFGLVSLSLVLAGAVGNLIDRVFMGYVTDMFHLLFIRFAVFNVADICVVIGGIATCIYLMFFFDKWEQSTGKAGSDGNPDADG
jgi:signal peptidase II